MHLTGFVSRGAQTTEVRKLLTDNRLVTLAGVGGAATTRLAVEVAARMAEKDCGQRVSEWHR